MGGRSSSGEVRKEKVEVPKGGEVTKKKVVESDGIRDEASDQD